MAMFAVGTGWRAPKKGIPTSVLIGTCYAAAGNVPIYLIGRWLGRPWRRFGRIHCDRISVGIANLWIAYRPASHLAAAARHR